MINKFETYTSYKISYDEYSFFIYKDYYNYMLSLTKLYEKVKNKFINTDFPKLDEWCTTQDAKDLIKLHASNSRTVEAPQSHRILSRSKYHDNDGIYLAYECELLRSVISHMFGDHAEKILSLINICVSLIKEDDIKDEIERCYEDIQSLKEKKFKLWGERLDLLDKIGKNIDRYNNFE